MWHNRNKELVNVYDFPKLWCISFGIRFVKLAAGAEWSYQEIFDGCVLDI